MTETDSLSTLTLFFSTILLLPATAATATAACQYDASDGDKFYKYSLASPLARFPHGVLSEDGFYKVASNDTILWFQLCDGMIFNHDPPRCVDCLDCGGVSRCGMGCSALVANNVGGYHVCTTIGDSSSFNINLVDKKSPHMGVTIKMTRRSTPHNCSLSVSVLCNQDGIRTVLYSFHLPWVARKHPLDFVEGPESLQRSGSCDYKTVLWHPKGCATVVPMHRKGWGWFSIFFTILLCLLGFYLLAGMVYRVFFLKIRGLDVIPHLDFWTSMPHRTRSWFMSTSLFHKFRGPTFRERSSYSAANF